MEPSIYETCIKQSLSEDRNGYTTIFGGNEDVKKGVIANETG
jgi:hypothetical protein